MKKILFLIIVMIFSTNVLAQTKPYESYSYPKDQWTCEPLAIEYKLSDYQQYIMYKSFQFGKRYDMGYSLAAIAYRESSAGTQMYNWNDPSAGPFHVLAEHVIKKFNMNADDPRDIDLAMNMLSSNFEFAALMAVETLTWWHNRHNGDWFRTWASYTKGYYWWESRPVGTYDTAMKYANDVRDQIHFIQDNCNWS